MIQSRVRINKEYAPLIFSVSLVCATPYSPTTQVYNENTGQFEPDRTVAPTILLPTVVAGASDGSFSSRNVNSLLGDLKWYVDGEDITALKEWEGGYEIDESSTSTRGAITIRKNTNQREQFALHFEASLPDSRLGTTHKIVTDEVLLSTIVQMESEYALSLVESGTVQYNPFEDKLFLHEYKIAHGLESAAPKEDEMQYLRKIPIKVYKGETEVTSGYTTKVYRVQSNGSLVEVPSDDISVAIVGDELVLDFRLIDKVDLYVKLFVGGREKGSVQLGVERAYPQYRVDIFGGTNITPTDWGHLCVISVHSNGNVVECPESYLKITWLTDTQALKGVKHHEGGYSVVALKDTGIGSRHDDSWLDVYVESEHKAIMAQAIDEVGNELTDKDGSVFIFN